MGRAPSLWLFATALAASPAAAQNLGLIVRDGTLGEDPPGTVAPGIDPNGDFTNYLITPQMGEQRGSNLFHSFAHFSIGEDETATFSGPAGIDNVISRVTGGEPSEIDGTLRSTIPGADVWLLNPSGVVFGEGAQLDVPGSFHAGTGDHVGFGEDALERFYGDPSRPSVLSTAQPEAFGFLGEHAAQPITVTGATLAVGAGEAIELAGGNVTLTGATLDAPGGAVSIRGGKIVVEEGSRVLAENAGEDPAGQITVAASESVLLDNGLLSVSTSGAGNAGTIYVESPEVTFQNGPGFPLHSESPDSPRYLDSPESPHLETQVGARAETTSSGEGGLITIDAGSLTIRNGVAVSATALNADLAGDPGTVQITGGSVELLDNSWLGAGAWGDQGGAGTVRIDLTGTLRLDAGEPRGAGLLPYAFISTFAGGARAPGQIDVEAGSVELANGGRIGGCTFCTSNRLKDAANIRIGADRIVIEGVPEGAHGSEASAVSVNTSDAGDAGTIEITTGSLILREGGFLGASSWGAGSTVAAGNAGDIGVKADSLVIEGSPGVFSGIWAGADGAGRAGRVFVHGRASVHVDSVSISEGGVITVGRSGSGDGGHITIDVDSVSTSGGGSINASSSGSGKAGAITIDTSELNVDGGFIAANGGEWGRVDAEGNAGTITVDADSVNLTNGGTIFALTSGSGQGGTIAIGANLVNVTASGVAVDTRGSGGAGTITMDVGSLNVTDGAFINAITFGSGDAGTITIDADLVRLSGSGQDFGSRIEAGALIEVGSSTGPTGNAGTVDITTGTLVIEHGGFIEAISSTRPLGGFPRGGDAGTIRVTASKSISLTSEGEERFSLLKLLLREFFPNEKLAPFTGVFASTVYGGAGGSITLDAPEITVSHGAMVSTATVGGGAGGTVDLRGDRIRVVDGGNVNSMSLRLYGSILGGDAGKVTLTGMESIEVAGVNPGFPEDRSSVTSATLGAGEAGTLTLRAPRIVVDDGGRVTTTALPARFFPDEGGGRGNIALDADQVIVRGGGRIDASTFVDEPGGDIEVVARESILVEGEESGIGSRAGRSGAGGGVALRAPRIEIADGGEVTAESSPGYQGVSSPLLESEGFVEPDHRRDGSLKPAAGDAGAIRIDAEKLVHLDAGAINSSVTGAAGGDIFIGDVTTPEAMILENGSRIEASAATTGSGGVIGITADSYFAFPGSVVSADAADPELSGTVEVNTPDVNLAGQLTALPSSYLDAASLMRERCAARRSGERAGSFAVRGSDGIPAEPDGWLPASAGLAGTPIPNLEPAAGSGLAMPALLAATSCR